MRNHFFVTSPNSRLSIAKIRQTGVFMLYFRLLLVDRKKKKFKVHFSLSFNGPQLLEYHCIRMKSSASYNPNTTKLEGVSYASQHSYLGNQGHCLVLHCKPPRHWLKQHEQASSFLRESPVLALHS